MVCLNVSARLEYVCCSLNAIARNAKKSGDKALECRYVRYCIDFIKDRKNAQTDSEKLTLAFFYESLFLKNYSNITMNSRR